MKKMDPDITARAYKTLFREYPDVVSIKDVASMLNIGIKKAYSLVNDGTLKSIPCGKTIKVAKITVINYVLQYAKF